MRKPRFRVGQVVYSLRWTCYGLLTKRLSKTFREGWSWVMTNPRGVVHRREITVVDQELRPLTKREAAGEGSQK